jgi:CBS domain-containing protein
MAENGRKRPGAVGLCLSDYGTIFGIMSGHFTSSNWVDKMNVEDLLHHSPLRLICSQPESPISEAAQRMAKFNVGLVVVIDDDNRVAGVLSERDIVKGLGDAETDLEETVVGDLMTKSIITISPTDSFVEAVLTMNRHNIRHLVVVQANKPVGVLSIRDLFGVFAKELSDAKSDTVGALKMDSVEPLTSAAQ